MEVTLLLLKNTRFNTGLILTVYLACDSTVHILSK